MSSPKTDEQQNLDQQTPEQNNPQQSDKEQQLQKTQISQSPPENFNQEKPKLTITEPEDNFQEKGLKKNLDLDLQNDGSRAGENSCSSPIKENRKESNQWSDKQIIMGERSGFGDEDFQDNLSHQAKKSRMSKKSKRSKRSKKPAEFKLFLGGLPGDTDKGKKKRFRVCVIRKN